MSVPDTWGGCLQPMVWPGPLFETSWPEKPEDGMHCAEQRQTSRRDFEPARHLLVRRRGSLRAWLLPWLLINEVQSCLGQGTVVMPVWWDGEAGVGEGGRETFNHRLRKLQNKRGAEGG